MTKPTQQILLLLSCPIAGAVYALAALTTAMAIYEPTALFSHTLWSMVAPAAMIGAFCGFLSIAYVVPLLANTDLNRTAPRMFLVTLAASTISGPTLILAPVLAFVVQLAICIVEYRRAAAARSKIGICLTCGYSLTGLPSPICPECGTDASLPRPE